MVKICRCSHVVNLKFKICGTHWLCVKLPLEWNTVYIVLWDENWGPPLLELLSPKSLAKSRRLQSVNMTLQQRHLACLSWLLSDPMPFSEQICPRQILCFLRDYWFRLLVLFRTPCGRLRFGKKAWQWIFLPSAS